jgi:tRNA nucleotidyltransferase (CCA-adding enzyme)
MKYFKGERDVMRELNSNKLQGPVVVVDPTYKYRNVCAGLGLSTFERFLEASEEFLKRPSLEFFERKDVDIEGLKEFARKKKVRFLAFELESDRQEGDIAGTKMRKIFRFFERELVKNGQDILRSEFDYDGRGRKAKGYLVVVEKGEVEVRGPSVGLENQAEEFCKAKGDTVFKKKGFWWCKKKVSIEGVLEFVKGFEKEMGSKIKIK